MSMMQQSPQIQLNVDNRNIIADISFYEKENKSLGILSALPNGAYVDGSDSFLEWSALVTGLAKKVDTIAIDLNKGNLNIDGLAELITIQQRGTSVILFNHGESTDRLLKQTKLEGLISSADSIEATLNARGFTSADKVKNTPENLAYLQDDIRDAPVMSALKSIAFLEDRKPNLEVGINIEKVQASEGLLALKVNLINIAGSSLPEGHLPETGRVQRELTKELLAQINDNPNALTVELNLGDIETIQKGSIVFLIEMQRELERRGGELKLVNAEAFKETLNRTKLIDRFLIE